MIAPYSEDQRDALQEVVNIAMGQAGASLASIFDVFVKLSVPQIQILEVKDVSQSVSSMVGSGTQITAVRQSFYDSMRGEAIMIYNSAGCKDLADLMGYDTDIDDNIEKELLLDVSNILVGASLCGIAEQLDTELSFTAPSIMGLSTYVETLLEPCGLGFSHALLIEVNFSLEERNFTSHLIILMPEESIELMRTTLDRFMESL